MLKNLHFSNHFNTKLISINKSSFWIGIFLFSFQSIAIYLFCNLLLDTIRITCYFEHEYYILNNQERYYFNLIFAYFAIITGYHTFLKWIVRSPINFIIHEKRDTITNWKVHFYLSEVLFYVIFALIFFYGRMNFVFPGYFLNVNKIGYLWIFPFIVLFVYFLSIFLIFSKRRIKFRILFIIISFTILSILAFGLANFNTLHYKKWDDHFLELNPHLNCHFNIPESKVYDDEYFNRPRGLKPIYLYLNKEGSVEVIFNHSKIPFNLLVDSLQNYYKYSEEHIKSMPVYMDHNVSFMQYNQFRKTLYDQNIHWIEIIIKDPMNYYPFNNSREKVIQYRISNYLFEPPMDSLKLKETFLKFSNIIHVNLIDLHTYQINGKNTPIDSLKSVLKSLILKDSNYIIHYKFKKEIILEHYLKIFIKAREALYEINENQFIDYQNNELYETSNQADRIPLMIYEESY